MEVSLSVRFKLDSSTMIRVISMLMALAHLIHTCGLK
jgi:hypothetical protein